MNKPPVKSSAEGSGQSHAQLHDLSPSASPRPGNWRRPIQVRAFSDSRRVDARRKSRPLQRDIETSLLDATGSVAADGLLVTRLFVNALRRAGHQVVSGVLEGNEPAAVDHAVLDGRIWSFDFQTATIAVLDVDLSLSLSDGRTSEVLWQREFPADDNLPFWIGLGCKSGEALRAALKEVEEAALLEFSSAGFPRLVGGREANDEPASLGPGCSHHLVSGSSWTGTEEGEITASAHETAPSMGSAENPVAHKSEPASNNSQEVSMQRERQ